MNFYKKEVLKRYVWIAASYFGICIRTLTILDDFLGAIGLSIYEFYI